VSCCGSGSQNLRSPHRFLLSAVMPNGERYCNSESGTVSPLLDEEGRQN